MNTALRATVGQYTTRETLEASFRAARTHVETNGELVLNAASRAGQLLFEHGDVVIALAIEDRPDFFGAQVRSYLRVVLKEEREKPPVSESARDARRRAPTISDEASE